MSDGKNFSEKEAANYFIQLNSVEDKKEYINNLPPKTNINKIQQYLPNYSAKAEFYRLYSGKQNGFNKSIRVYNKKRNELISKLKSSHGNYKKAKTYLNPLRKNSEDLLRNEALQLVIKKNNKFKNFYDEIIKAETILQLIKNSSQDPQTLKKILNKNANFLKSHRVTLENLKDLFENTDSLKSIQNDFNGYLINHIEDEKPTDQVIKESEERILTSDIDKVYNEITKVEQLIATNIGQALINLYNTIQVMDAKKNFIRFIVAEFENQNIPPKYLDILVKKAEEYRNVELPNKWTEMLHKLKFTHTPEHYGAWFYGLQFGRYYSVVSNVKEYITKEIIKRIFNQIIEKYKSIDLNSFNFIQQLGKKTKTTNAIKEIYKNFLNNPEISKYLKDPLIMQFDNYMRYLFYLDYYLSKDLELLNQLFDNLTNIKQLQDKIKFIEEFNQNIKKHIEDKKFKIYLNDICHKLIELYQLLIKKKTTKIEEIKPKSEVTEFLNKMISEFEIHGKLSNFSEKTANLSNDSILELIPIIRLDPRFEEYFLEVEDTLYDMEWGRTMGIIGLKLKQVQKKYGNLAAEEYLEDLVNRVVVKKGENSFIVKRIRNMKENLIKLNDETTKKLHYLKEKLDKAKNNTAKIIELQKISRDPRYKGIFGTIKNMERILIRDHFSDIYRKVQKLPIETQKILFDGLQDDLKSLLIYEPEIYNKVKNYISIINNTLSKTQQVNSSINDQIVDALQNYEKGELPLIELNNLIELEPPGINYNETECNHQINEIENKVNKGEKEPDDLDSIIEEVMNDKIYLKLDGSDEALNQIKTAENFQELVQEQIKKAEKINKIKEKKSINDIVQNVLNEESENIIKQIDILENIFDSKDFNLTEKINGFIISAKMSKNKNNVTLINEIVEVIRRMEKEIEPIHNLEYKIVTLNQWIYEDYADKEHIKEFLTKQIAEMALIQGQEGGLMRKLFDGLEKAGNKINYLNKMLKEKEYKHLKPFIQSLIDNIKMELDIPEDQINEQLIEKNLENKNDDQKLTWLKTHKYWHKFDQINDLIEKEINSEEEKIKKKMSHEVIIYPDIIELINAVLDLDGPGKRQSLIKAQWEKDPQADANLNAQRKLLFYLFSSNTNEPKDRLKALADRVTLSTAEKQKYLQLLKKSSSEETGSLMDALQINNQDLAFYAVYVLYSDKQPGVRINLLNRFKGLNDEKAVQYKNFFEITNNTIDEMIKYLSNILKNQNKTSDQGADKPIGDNETKKEKTTINNEVKPTEIVTQNAQKENPLKIDQEISEQDPKEPELFFKQENHESEEKMENDLLQNNISLENIAEKPVEQIEENNPANEISEDMNELKEINTKPSIKSDQEMLKEQMLREQFNKKQELFDETTKKKVVKRIEQRGKNPAQETVEKITRKAHEISETKNQKLDEKIANLISYLTTCYPESISNIIKDEILPIFRGEGLNLEIYNLIESINNNIFKPALQGNNVEKNISFFEKKLSPDNINNIKLIIDRIEKLWHREAEAIKKEEQEFEKTLQEINQGKGFMPILIYLNNIFPENIVTELQSNLIINMQNTKIKDGLKLIYNALQNLPGNNTDNGETIKSLQRQLNLNAKEEVLLQEIINKLNSVKTETKTAENEKLLKPKQNKNEPDNMTAPLNEQVNETNNSTDSRNKENNIVETSLINLNKFVKPHSYILEIIRNTKSLDEQDFDVETRRQMITKLVNENKIFSYDGTNYIGKGQINNLVKNNQIPKNERSIFVEKLDAIVKKINRREELFDYLGVKNEVELRQLNFFLDKYSVNRSYNLNASIQTDKSIPQMKNKEDKSSNNQELERKNIKENYDKIEQRKNTISPEKNRSKVAEQYQKKIDKLKKKEEEKKISYEEIIKKQNEFISKTQTDLLKEAMKEINKNLERLIKTAKSSEDLDSIYKTYFGNNEFNKRNLLNLCFELKQITEIIRKDNTLLSRLSFNKEKMQKLIDNSKKRFK